MGGKDGGGGDVEKEEERMTFEKSDERAGTKDLQVLKCLYVYAQQLALHASVKELD